jgi:hypothetical protein
MGLSYGGHNRETEAETVAVGNPVRGQPLEGREQPR